MSVPSDAAHSPAATAADEPPELPTTAAAIAAGVRAGDVSARAVLEGHLAAIDAREPEVHAFNLVLADEARAAADEIDRRVAAGDDPGPLAGVPIALKDVLVTRGLATTAGSKILAGWIPPYDAHVVEHPGAPEAKPTIMTRLRRQPSVGDIAAAAAGAGIAPTSAGGG